MSDSFCSLISALMISFFIIILVMLSNSNDVGHMYKKKIYFFETTLPLEEGSWSKIEFCFHDNDTHKAVTLDAYRIKRLVGSERGHVWGIRAIIEQDPEEFVLGFLDCATKEFEIDFIGYVLQTRTVTISKNDEKRKNETGMVQEKIIRRLGEDRKKSRINPKITRKIDLHGSRVSRNRIRNKK